MFQPAVGIDYCILMKRRIDGELRDNCMDSEIKLVW